MDIRVEPKVATSEVMQIIMSISAREFFRLHPDIRRRYFWGGKLRTLSYFIEAMCNANEEVIRQYVLDQLNVMEAIHRQLGLL